MIFNPFGGNEICNFCTIAKTWGRQTLRCRLFCMGCYFTFKYKPPECFFLKVTEKMYVRKHDKELLAVMKSVSSLN